jgi:hypothetical protein
MPTDEEIVDEALQIALRYIHYSVAKDKVVIALSALDRLSVRCLPQLPEGWSILNLYQRRTLQGFSMQIGKKQAKFTGTGPTPRAACEAAIAKLGEGA